GPRRTGIRELRLRRSSAHRVPPRWVEDFGTEMDARACQPLGELRSHTGCPMEADDSPFRVDPLLLEGEDVLRRDDVLLHSDYLGHPHDFPRAIRESGHVDDEIQR